MRMISDLDTTYSGKLTLVAVNMNCHRSKKGAYEQCD